jgi:transposase-like protein
MPHSPFIHTHSNGVTHSQRPDAEVVPKAKRRSFSPAYKLLILEEADRCTEPGQIGALLRREGLYSSNLTTWRRQRRQGQLKGLTPKKRGPKPDAREQELAALRREKEQLERRLEKAETIIAFQKKLSRLLGLTEDTSSEKP